MRKRIIGSIKQSSSIPDRDWLDLERLADVEVTSEASDFPVEAALLPNKGQGWRAEQPGPQLIRLIFDKPQKLKEVVLAFNENEIERTQEFVLRWSPDGGRSFREIVRQQWNFNPGGTTREIEEYRLELSGVTVFELEIIPDISGGNALASLDQLRLAGF
jgi:hypothetical protein